MAVPQTSGVTRICIFVHGVFHFVQCLNLGSSQDLSCIRITFLSKAEPCFLACIGDVLFACIVIDSVSSDLWLLRTEINKNLFMIDLAFVLVAMGIREPALLQEYLLRLQSELKLVPL